ncbi:hypothetical protein MKX03_016959 [Papaver bracteatum]|nr:hypothetical protein MKX03_016959 [Papaver bracteatum]
MEGKGSEDQQRAADMTLCTRPCSKNGEFHLIYQLISFGTFREVLKPVFFALCSNLGSILCATPLFQQISFVHVLVDAARIRIGFLLTIHFVVEIFVCISFNSLIVLDTCRWTYWAVYIRLYVTSMNFVTGKYMTMLSLYEFCNWQVHDYAILFSSVQLGVHLCVLLSSSTLQRCLLALIF